MSFGQGRGASYEGREAVRGRGPLPQSPSGRGEGRGSSGEENIRARGALPQVFGRAGGHGEVLHPGLGLPGHALFAMTIHNKLLIYI